MLLAMYCTCSLRKEQSEAVNRRRAGTTMAKNRTRELRSTKHCTEDRATRKIRQ